MHMVSPNTTTAQPLPTTAEIIAHDLQRLLDDEQLLQRAVGVCLTLARHGFLSTTQEVGALHAVRVQRELALVRAAKRHLQTQARLEHLDICDLCGTASFLSARTGQLGLAHVCLPCGGVA